MTYGYKNICNIKLLLLFNFKTSLFFRAESAPLRTDVEVRIEVEDVNDNQPTLEDFRIVYNVVEDEPLPAVVGRIPAEDADPTSRLR